MKLSFSIFFLIVVNTSLLSQTSFGIKAGLNLSKAIYSNEYNEQLVDPIRKLKPGIVAGFVINHQLNEVISVQAEVLYSQKGLKTEQASLYKYVNSMNYIEIPFSGQYSIIQNKYSKLSILIGGYGAYWTDGKYKRTYLITSETTSYSVDFNSEDYEYNRIDAGIFIGTEFTKEQIEFFIRYTHSMLGSSKENADALSNHVFSIGINYFIFQ
ncbi:MAG: PorT family protein [Chlorobi bacterium]|nr:PorT family protein [Chlorobiota bacterium]